MLIRKATEKDFEQYFKLIQISNKELDHYYNNQSIGINKEKYKKNILLRIKKKNWYILIAEEKNKIVGFFEGLINNVNQGGYLFKIQYIGYINNVFVKKEYRKKGLFKSFQKEFEKYLKSKNIKQCVLHISAINMPALIAYKKTGFKIKEYKMQKELK